MVYDYKEKFSVQGKKCIVTGGAQGLSRGMAEGFWKTERGGFDGSPEGEAGTGGGRIL